MFIYIFHHMTIFTLSISITSLHQSLHRELVNHVRVRALIARIPLCACEPVCTRKPKTYTCLVYGRVHVCPRMCVLVGILHSARVVTPHFTQTVRAPHTKRKGDGEIIINFIVIISPSHKSPRYIVRSARTT